MTLLFREMFSTTGILTPAAPGHAFSRVVGMLHQRAGGPRLGDGPAASADPRAEEDSAYGIYDLENPSETDRILLGGWFYFKSLQEHEGSLLVLLDQYDHPGPQITVQGGRLFGGVAYAGKSVCPIIPLQGWIYLAVASVKEEEGKVSLRYYYKLPGQPLESWGAQNHVYVTREQTTGFQAGFAGNAPTTSLRMGAVAGYTFDAQDFSDISYPTEVVEPNADIRHVWYCNPASGNDANDGTTADRAWKSAAKINEESRHAGFFAASSHAKGDVLIIDTAGEVLDLNGMELEFSTPGLTVKAAEGVEWIRIKSHHVLQPDDWDLAGAPGVYVTEDTEPHIVVWENDKFMHHPAGATYSQVEAELSATPGSFWTDGTRLYVHPFDSTDPRIDGKQYDRSKIYSKGSPVTLAAPDLNIGDIYTGKTCLAEKSTHDALGGYCMGNKGRAGRTLIRHCYLYYGSKHNLGLTEGVAGDVIEVEDVQVEQGSPYPTFGGQTVLVSFSAGESDLGIRHVYKRCVSRANAGRIGSAEGEISSKFPVFYSHNLGGRGQFESIEFIDCDFGVGTISGGGAEKYKISGSKTGSLLLESDVILHNSQVTGTLWCRSGNRLTMTNCIVQMEGMMRGNPFEGTLDVQFCTLDASRVTSHQMGVPQSAIFTRMGPLEVTFKNNIVLMPPESVYANLFSQLSDSDTLDFSNNAYSLNGNRLVYHYKNGSIITNPTLVEWQMLGQDKSSFEAADMKLSAGYYPQTDSSVIGAAVKTTNRTDFTGQTFLLRDDIGALQTLPRNFEDWRQRHFSEEELLGNNAEGEDSFAQDGLPNIVKYALGLDPRSPNHTGIFTLRSGPKTGTGVWNYQRLSGISDVIYSVEVSEDLRSWRVLEDAEEQVEAVAGGRESVSVLFELGAKKTKFFRLSIDRRAH